MKSAVVLGLLFAGLVYSAPTSKKDTILVNSDFFPEELKIYEGQHDIVKIYVPLNKLNFDETNNTDDSIMTLFFVEADVNGAETTDQGLYVKKGENVQKLLDHGRDIAAPFEEESTEAYFAAKDGIYRYNAEENKAVKYGSIDDDLIGIVMGNIDTMYVLSADKKVYKVSENGNKKEEVDKIKNAEQIVIDLDGNLYYVDSENKLFIVNSDNVKQVETLPENYSKVTLIRPPFIFKDGGIPVVVDKKIYTLHVNGTLDEEDFELDTTITAYAIEATILQYYAREKKIYEYNLIALVLSEILGELQEFFNRMKIDIQSIASKPLSEFMSKTETNSL